MKAVNLREHTDDELMQMCETARKALSDLKVKRVSGDASEQPLLIREKRREVARIMTVINEKAREAKAEDK